MRRTILALTSLCVLFCGRSGMAALTPSSGVEGHWEGIIQIRPAEFEVNFSIDLKRQSGGPLGGELSFLTQEALHQPLEKVSLDGSNIVFSTRDTDGVVSAFQGWLLDGGDRIQGDLTEKGEHYIFALKRSGAPTPGHVQLPVLSQDSAQLKSLFNQDQAKVRLLLIVSPTCPMCRNGAGLVERYVLEQIVDPRLKVYVVWEHINPEDTPATAAKAASFIADPRAIQFWADHRSVGQTFQGKLGFRTSPAWDVFLLFPMAEQWHEGGPTPAVIMSNLPLKEEAKYPRLNAIKLADQIKVMLASPAPGSVGGQR